MTEARGPGRAAIVPRDEVLLGGFRPEWRASRPGCASLASLFGAAGVHALREKRDTGQKPFAGDVRNAGRGGAKAPRGQPAVVRQCRHCGAGRHRRPLTASGTEGSLSAITSKGGQSSGVGLIGGAEVRRVYVPRQPGLSLTIRSEERRVGKRGVSTCRYR